MKISDALNGVRLPYVETAPFIYYTESRPGYDEKVRAIFREVHIERLRVITSVITIPETLMKPLQAADRVLVRRYRAMFHQTQGVSLMSVTARIADSAAELRAAYNLRTPDALHVASAIDANCDTFLSNDKGLKRLKEINVLLLDDLEVDPPIQ